MSEELDKEPTSMPIGVRPATWLARRDWRDFTDLSQSPAISEEIPAIELALDRFWGHGPVSDLPDTLLAPPSVTVAATVEVFPPYPRPRVPLGECRMGSYLPGPDEAAHQFYHDWHGTRCAWDAPATPWYARLWRAVRGWVES